MYAKRDLHSSRPGRFLTGGSSNGGPPSCMRVLGKVRISREQFKPHVVISALYAKFCVNSCFTYAYSCSSFLKKLSHSSIYCSTYPFIHPSTHLPKPAGRPPIHLSTLAPIQSYPSTHPPTHPLPNSSTHPSI